MKRSILFFWILTLPLFVYQETVAQNTDTFKMPEFRKIELSETSSFEQQNKDVMWTGQGFQGRTAIDQIPAVELRARLQTVFGNPTKRLGDLITKPDFRLGEAIQYEYWFVVNETIPIMILDIDGPFATGLVYAGPVAYIDYLPEIKRTLSAKLMEVNRFDEFTDIFYSPERNQWYEIRYKDGEFETKETARPAKYRNINLN